MIEEAIQYPRSGDDALKTVLIGGVLGLLSVLIVPALLVLGYLVRVLQASFDDESPPVFEAWGDLLVDGVKALVIGIVYFIVPMVVFGLAAGGIAISAIMTGDISPGALAGAFFGFLLGGLLALIAWYILPAALANFAREGRMSAAFRWADLRPVLFSSTYAINWVVALVLFIVAAIIVGILNVVPPVGFVVGAFVDFYVAVVAFYLFGRAFVEVKPVKSGSEPPAGQATA